jgi:general secretion pathway protein A
MYQEFFGFRAKPFSLTPDPAYFYRSDCHQNALAVVGHGLRQRQGPMTITGTSGTGKTTLCRMMLDELDRTTFTALVLNPYVSEQELLQGILRDFGVIAREEAAMPRGASAGTAELLRTLNDFLRSLVPLGANALLLVDEAQKLPVGVLQQLQRIASLVEPGHSLVQLVLVGQLGLRDRLRLPELRDLASRVSIRYRLRPLTAAETSAYVTHRLRVAGDGSRTTFASVALKRVHYATGGNPRLINVLCDRALQAAFVAGAPSVEPEIVTLTARSLGLGAPEGSFVNWFRRVAAL